MWNLPKEPNGIITGYEVVYGVYEEDNSTTANVERELTYTIDNLSELSNGNCSLCAINIHNAGFCPDHL